MTNDRQQNTATEANAAPIVAGPTARAVSKSPDDLEAAWGEWSSGIQKVDDRGMPLLRKAFEAGWEAAQV